MPRNVGQMNQSQTLPLCKYQMSAIPGEICGVLSVRTSDESKTCFRFASGLLFMSTLILKAGFLKLYFHCSLVATAKIA